MRKIIFLLLLTISISAYSQTELHIFFSNTIETCDGSGTQSCLNIGVEGMNGSFIDLLITNVNDQSDFFQFGVPPETESQINEYCANFTAGGSYAIKAIDFFGERESITLQHTFLGCSIIDIDGDTYPANVDCNDRDSTIYPGATEICDRKDNNCNNQIDEGFTQNTYYWDADLDGYGNPNLIKVDCQGGGRYILQAGDCNDSDASINPGATEICGDGIDNNCDGNIDEGCDCSDADNDTVCDADDICPGSNDLFDSDNDGTPDCLDNCPNDPNKIALGECGCGVAETDSDSDGTPDCNDACPNDPNKIAPGDCGCGVADTDSDSDGTLDCNDACPNDPNKIAPGDCGCGVAETDSDLDGTPDCNDTCPNDPNKIASGDCGCGVADTDSDADGTPDCIDECPNDPNNTCNNCPDIDNDTICDADDICPGANDLLDSDRDGTPDCIDNCPNDRNKTEPGLCGCGTSDADKDADGVPDCNDVCPRGPDTDSDGDGVPDCIDICDGGDDTIDTDSDGLPDCVDTCPNDATNTCTANTCRAGYFEICHTMKNGSFNTLCVTSSQWERHKNHPGDALGACFTPAAAKFASENKATLTSQPIIHPNPIKLNGIWIKFSTRESKEKFKTTLFDLSGKILAEKVFESNYKTDGYFWEFNNTSLDDGVFLLKIEDGAQSFYKRILKLKN